MNVQPVPSKILAVLEVFLVIFGVIPLITLGIYRLFPGFEAWQTETLGFPFPVFVYVVMMAAVLTILFLRRKKWAAYGLTFTHTKFQLDIAAASFLPVAVSNFPLAFNLDFKRWGGALIMAAVEIGLLFLLGWMLRKKPSARSLEILLAGFVLFQLPLTAENSVLGKALIAFLTYAFFVGFGEEILYRGYMQSRLNEVFPARFHFFGVQVGWGLIIASVLFGLTHVGMLSWALGRTTQVTPAWGFWTMFSGLVFGFVREKSGGILAPALLHGLPQAIATAVMVFL